jgi:CelD/BcsL family acetyltransferase involved in cellulose biosynthesis
MRIRTIRFDHLTKDEIAAWSEIQRSHVAFCSPFFRPEFAQIVAAVRADVEVAVLEESGRPVGFFPFHRRYFNTAQPIGGGLSEFHGLIAPPDIHCDPIELLRACGLSSWRFEHLVSIHPSFARYSWSSADSPYVDLSAGFERYLQMRDNGARLRYDFQRKKRKLERDAGPFRYEHHVADPAVLETCIHWKTEQARRTGLIDIFKNSWIPRLLNEILKYQGQDFAAAMPVCYAGDRIAAINFGIRSGDVFHSWFPAYNVELADYSPGYLHFIEMMRSCESTGIRRIILGMGSESYKDRFMSGADRVAQGCVNVHSGVALARSAWRQAREAVKSSSFAKPARLPVRMVSRFTTWLAFR